jgi:hypothetical protein
MLSPNIQGRRDKDFTTQYINQNNYPGFYGPGIFLFAISIITGNEGKQEKVIYSIFNDRRSSHWGNIDYYFWRQAAGKRICHGPEIYF